MNANKQDKNFSIEELLEMYQSGMSLRQIAELTGTSHQAVWKRLRRAGVNLRHVGISKGQKLNRGVKNDSLEKVLV